MTEIVQHKPAAEMGAFNENDDSLVRYLGLNPNSPQDRAAVAVCRQYGFDPILKHVVVIPKGGVYITRDGLLNVAHRSGQLDGIVVEQEPMLDQQTNEWVARVSVYRKDMRHPFTFPGRYPAQGGNKAYAPEMALKCAEAHALRRAFDVTGLPTFDERKPEDAPATSGPAFVKSSQGEQPGPPPTEDVHDAELEAGEPQPLTDSTRKRMFAALTKVTKDEDEQRRGISQILGREVESRATITEPEAWQVIDHLKAHETQQGIAAEQGGEG